MSEKFRFFQAHFLKSLLKNSSGLILAQPEKQCQRIAAEFESRVSFTIGRYPDYNRKRTGGETGMISWYRRITYGHDWVYLRSDNRAVSKGLPGCPGFDCQYGRLDASGKRLENGGSPRRQHLRDSRRRLDGSGNDSGIEQGSRNGYVPVHRVRYDRHRYVLAGHDLRRVGGAAARLS